MIVYNYFPKCNWCLNSFCVLQMRNHMEQDSRKRQKNVRIHKIPTVSGQLSSSYHIILVKLLFELNWNLNPVHLNIFFLIFLPRRKSNWIPLLSIGASGKFHCQTMLESRVQAKVLAPDGKHQAYSLSKSYPYIWTASASRRCSRL